MTIENPSIIGLSTPRRAAILPEAAAAYVGLKPKTLELYRHRGIGPAFIRYNSRCVRYRISDLDAWLASKTIYGDAA